MTLRYCTGVGLVEVLVVLLLFSLAFGGFSGLQLQTRRNGLEAEQQSLALELADDLFERVRSNPGQLSVFVASELGATQPSFAVDCRVQGCTPGQLAAWDLARWTGRLRGETALAELPDGSHPANGLVNGRACVSVSGRRLALIIVWRSPFLGTLPSLSECAHGGGLYGEQQAHRRELRRSIYIGGGS